MTSQNPCPACGKMSDDCEDDFHQMLYWEAERPDFAMQVHHLLVLGYHLQHPQLYSPETLAEGIKMLKAFVVDGVSPQMMRKQLKDAVDSGKRKHKITGTDEHHGKYETLPQWSMRAADVVAAGLLNYVESCKAWAKHIYEDLEAAGYYQG